MNKDRPLSPHITVHKWILTQIMSILHRSTGIGLSMGMLFISLWLFSLTFGQNYYSIFQFIFFNYLGKIIIIIILFCFYFYFIDELRKLFWALGIGLEIKAIKITSYLVFFISVIFLFFSFIFLL
tara:strand:+ start:2445 stop:2819 length:375 start_codon:yes stop_codon:yes gene_type:complete